MMNPRVRAVEAYLKALRTGEASASAIAARYLTPDVVLDTVGAHMWGNGHEEFHGHEQTVTMITGIGVMTGVYRTAPWSNPTPDGPDALKVSAEIGGLLASSTLTFSFNERDQIVRIDQVNKGGPPAPTADRIPDFVKGIVNSALVNNTPMIVAYTDERGAPNPEVRDHVFDLAPEVEQNHDPGHIGAALIIDLDRVTGNTPAVRCACRQ